MSDKRHIAKFCCCNGIVVVVSETKLKNDELRKSAKVHPGSYACTLVDRIYHYIYGRSIDAKALYKKYYEVEYPSMLHFLYHKYGIPGDIIKNIKTEIESNQYIGISINGFGRDWQINSMIERYESSFDNSDSLLTMLLDAVSVQILQ